MFLEMNIGWNETENRFKLQLSTAVQLKVWCDEVLFPESGTNMHYPQVSVPMRRNAIILKQKQFLNSQEFRTRITTTSLPI
jgi:hypothetical protein